VRRTPPAGVVCGRIVEPDLQRSGPAQQPGQSGSSGQLAAHGSNSQLAAQGRMGGWLACKQHVRGHPFPPPPPHTHTPPPQRRLSPASSLCTLPGPRQHPGRWCSASRWCRYQMRRCLHGAPATRRGLRGALSVPLRLHSSASQAAAQAHGSAAVRPPAAQPGALGAGQAGSPTSQQPLLPAGGEAGCWLLIGAHPCAPRQSWCSCRRARRPGWP
jgi:hypothetical protein